VAAVSRHRRSEKAKAPEPMPDDDWMAAPAVNDAARRAMCEGGHMPPPGYARFAICTQCGIQFDTYEVDDQ